jgi:nucleoside-diphosphate-sugar epimerase
MPTTLIYGGHGKVALHLTSLLAKSSPAHRIISVIRNPEHSAEIKSLGGTPLVQSIESATVDELAESLRSNGVESVVWSAGAGGGDPSRTDKVDREGAIKSMDACAQAGVKRYIIVSALDLRDRAKSAPSWYDEDDKNRSDRVWVKKDRPIED